ncbi:MAG: glycosyl hydrolase family 8 [Candidatus Saccharimonadales bacterium]
MRKFKRPILIFVAVAVFLSSIGVIAAVFYRDSEKKDEPLVYANNQMLLELWSDYKSNYIEPGTNRTLDKQQNNISTSEGQSYTMLRAVWVDDQKTFDESWQWTKDNLQRDDFLLSWKFGQLPDGTYGIQDTVGGQNTATDGDSDIALSLLMAYSRWQQDKYLYDALPLISAMWEKEVVIINGKPVLAANDLERKNPKEIIVNPSYFAPYAYKVFANVDKKHDWQALADNSYVLLTEISQSKLDASGTAGLPPDWVSIDRVTGAISAPANKDLTTRFSYDAIRTPWRLALDWQWHKDPRAKAVLANFGYLKDQWHNNKKIFSSYSHDGTALVDYDSPATYGATIGYFSVIDPGIAEEIYKAKLITLYSPDTQKLKQPLSYYDDNWSWFGSALLLDKLPNLTEVDNKR